MDLVYHGSPSLSLSHTHTQDDALELRSSQETLVEAAVPATAVTDAPDSLVPPDCSVVMTSPRQEQRRCLAPINVSSTC